MDEFLKIGVVSSVHGVHGHVKVYPTTDDVKRYKKLKSLYVLCKDEYILFKIQEVKFFKQMVIVKLEGIDTPEEAVKYKNFELYVDREHAVKLEKDEFFIADLLGINVISDDEAYKGTLTNVYTTGANDVYEIVLEDGRTVLLPAIKECIKDVDIDKGLLTFHMMDGLLD